MQPADFPESNIDLVRPQDMAESQCANIRAFVGKVNGGSCDGATVIVTAWKPSPEQLAEIVAGKPIYLSFIGGAPPHFVTTDFHSATHPA